MTVDRARRLGYYWLCRDCEATPEELWRGAQRRYVERLLEGELPT